MNFRMMTMAAVVGVLSIASTARAAEEEVRAAARGFYEGVEKADRKAIRDAMLADGAEQQQLADAFADVIVAGRKLAQAAAEKYGAAGEAIGQGMVSQREMERLNEAAVTIEGDRASIAIANASMPMKLQKADGRWRLVVSDYAGATAENLPKQVALLQHMATALEEAAEEIAADKYATAEDAEAAVTAKLNTVMIKALNPTTKPASEQ